MVPGAHLACSGTRLGPCSRRGWAGSGSLCPVPSLALTGPHGGHVAFPGGCSLGRARHDPVAGSGGNLPWTHALSSGRGQPGPLVPTQGHLHAATLSSLTQMAPFFPPSLSLLILQGPPPGSLPHPAPIVTSGLCGLVHGCPAPLTGPVSKCIPSPRLLLSCVP